MICSNFLEHLSCRLRLRSDENHKRAPPIPGFRAASMTARKSSLSAFGDELLRFSENASEDMKKGKWCGTDGTLKGYRDANQKLGYSGVRSCEVGLTHTYMKFHLYILKSI